MASLPNRTDGVAIQDTNPRITKGCGLYRCSKSRSIGACEISNSDFVKVSIGLESFAHGFCCELQAGRLHYEISEASAVSHEQASSGGWRRHWSWMKWLLAFSMLAIVIGNNREGISRIARQSMDWKCLFTAFALCGGATVLTFFRWYCLVKAQDFVFSVKDALRLGFIGCLFNFVAPGAVGGDFVKAALLAKEQPNRRTTAIATVLLDRILGLLALFLIGSCAAWKQWSMIRELPELQGTVALLAGGSIAGVVGLIVMLLPISTRLGWWQPLTRLPVVGKSVGELVIGVQLYQTRPGAILGALGLSLIGHVGTISAFYFSAKAVRGETLVPSFLSHLFFIPPAEFIGVIVPVPAGIGPLEFAVEKFYVLAHAAPGTGVVTCLGYRIVTLAVALIGAGYYMMARREIAQAMRTADSASDK